MGFLKRKSDPISDRSRALKSEIESLEAQIRQLTDKVELAKSQPKLRSTAFPQNHAPAPHPVRPSEPIFETVEKKPDVAEGATTPEHFNDLGVRKYDLPAVWKRICNHFQGPTANNPKLVNYLAAGSIKGLRPLRYEKRVARNRCIALCVVLILMLFGLISAFVHNN